MSYRRKLPPPEVLNRLYWLEDWSTREIAKPYGCTESAALKALVRAGIPRKKRRRPAECIAFLGPYRDPAQAICGKRVCLLKRINESTRQYYWTPTVRCLTHYIEEKRRAVREGQRKRRNSERSYQRSRSGRGKVQSWNWVREMPA